MKQKLTLLILALFTAVGAWADDITVNLVDGKTNGTAHDPIGTLMDKSGTILTSKAAAGLAGVVLSNVATSDQGGWNNQRHLTIKPSAGKTAEKITITAPQGYIITGYSISCCNFSSSCAYKIDKSDTYNASTATSISTYSSYTTISATYPSLPLTTSTTNTASLWIYAGAESESMNWLMINEFKVTLKQVITPPTSLTSGWYQLKWVDTAGASDYENADVNGKYVFNYATDVTVSSNDYALYLGSDVPSTLSEHATTFVYVAKGAVEGSYGISGNLQSANGRYISRSGASSLTKPDANYIIFFSSSSYPVNSVITSATSGEDRISLVPQGKNAISYIGQTNAANKYPMVQFFPVNLSEYNIQAWTVSILDPAGTHDVENTQVTYTGSNLYGLNKVYHNGTFFIASGTTPSATDFTAPVRDGVTPAISVDATNHIITVRYSVNVTYKMMFNGSEIKSVVVGENIGATASTPSAWTIPAFSSFTCPSTEITAETSEIEVTLSWDGPFEFSTDYASAKWYYMTVGGEYASNGTTNCPTNAVKQFDESALWAFIGNPYDGFKIYNYESGSGNTLYADGICVMNNSEYYKTWYAEKSDNKLYIYNDPEYYLLLTEYNSVRCVGSGIKHTTSSIITVEPYVVTYNLKFGGSTIATKTMDKVTGDSEDLFPSEWTRDFCTYSYEPAEIGNSTTSVDVTMTWNGPFNISADYENAVWYYLSVNDQWCKNNALGFESTPDFSSDIANVKGTDGGQWAFFGNPYDGFLLSLKEKFNNTFQVYLSSQLEAPGFTAPSYSSTEKWTVNRLSGTTFTLNCGDKYIVDNTTVMGFKTTALEGSEGTFSVRSYYCQQALDDLVDYASEHAVGQYFGAKQTDVDNMEAFILSYPKMTEDEYEESFPTLFSSYITTYYPPTGYYRLRNYKGSKDYYLNASSSKINGITDNTTASTIVKLINVGNVNSTFKIEMQGAFVQTPQDQVQNELSSDEIEFTPTIAIKDGESWVSLKAGNGDKGNLNLNGSYYAVGWTANGIDTNPASYWKVEAATDFDITLNGPIESYYYATLCVPFDVQISGASAFTLSRDGITMTKSSPLDVVSGGTPVLLVGEGDNATATIANANYETTISTSTDLTGNYLEIADFDGATNYVLGTDGSNVGFFHWRGTTLKANRAYLAGGDSNVKGFYIDLEDDPDAISLIQALSEGEVEIYNVAGQRLQKMQKGINIVNGKKILK